MPHYAYARLCVAWRVLKLNFNIQQTQRELYVCMYSRSSVWPFYNPGLPPSHTEKTHVLHFYFVLDPEPVSSPPFCCTASRIAEFISYVRLLQKWNFRHGKGYPLSGSWLLVPVTRLLASGSWLPVPTHQRSQACH